MHTFSRVLPSRTAPYQYVTVYCSVPGDTNHNNDTTSFIEPYSYDIEFLKIQVEENMTDSCQVRAVIRCNGNISFSNNFTIRTKINGGQEFTTNFIAGEYILSPGEIRHIPLPRHKIPKSRTREYIGNGRLIPPNPDANPGNEQTTIIEVINYFEGVPTVEEPNFTLEQNYPNPYDGTTRIEFAIPYSGNTRFFVTDVVGRLVHEENVRYDEGRHTITFDKGTLPSGVYYYGLEFDGQRRMHKMIIQ